MIRVKLYILNENRQWDDKGKGYVSVVACPSADSVASAGSQTDMMLVMKSEANPNVTLLESKILADTHYMKQQDTLIVWNEEANGDLALSFEEIKGCTNIYNQILVIQGDAPDSNRSDSSLNGESDSSLDPLNDSSTGMNGSGGGADDWRNLFEVGKLDKLCWHIENNYQTNMQKESLANIIESDHLVPKLLDLFDQCDDLENVAGLKNLYSIFKFFLSMGKTTLYEILFSDENIDRVIGALENPPNKPASRHREYIANATLKQAIPIKNERLLSKIRQTYKVQYLHDVILPTPPIVDDMNLYTLQSFIFLNKAEIVNMIQEDRNFLSSIITQITDIDSSYEEKKNSFGFLKELCHFSQSLEPTKRESFFHSLLEMNCLQAISAILSMDEEEEESSLQWAAVEVLAYFIEVCAPMVRQFMLEDSGANDSNDDSLLINLLLEQLLQDKDPELGGAIQILNLFRILLDFAEPPEIKTTLGSDLERGDPKYEFLSLFYSRTIPILMAPVLAATSDSDGLTRDDYRFALSAQVILKLLIFCLTHGHTYHIRNYLLKNDLIARILLLLKSKHTFLVLTALKFVRTIIGLKDDTYIRHIVANKLVQPVVNTYLRNGHAYNLLNSALIEFFDFIKTENLKSLIQQFGDEFSSFFEDVDYVETFKDLKIRHAQITEPPPAMGKQVSLDDSSSDTLVLAESPSDKSFKFSEDDWFNSEEDDHSPTMDAPQDDERWNTQFEFYTKQLAQKKKQSALMNGGDKSVFESVPLKAPPTLTAKENNIFNIAPIKNSLIVQKKETPLSDSDDQNILAPASRSISKPPPPSSLVDYEADSDEAEENSDDDNSAAAEPPSKRLRKTQEA